MIPFQSIDNDKRFLIYYSARQEKSQTQCKRIRNDFFLTNRYSLISIRRIQWPYAAKYCMRYAKNLALHIDDVWHNGRTNLHLHSLTWLRRMFLLIRSFILVRLNCTSIVWEINVKRTNNFSPFIFGMYTRTYFVFCCFLFITMKNITKILYAFSCIINISSQRKYFCFIVLRVCVCVFPFCFRSTLIEKSCSFHSP